MHILKGYTKQEISWMMYDWANSAHSVIIVTLLPIFFDTVAGYTADSVSSMSTWGYATSIAMLIVALAAPFLGVYTVSSAIFIFRSGNICKAIYIYTSLFVIFNK